MAGLLRESPSFRPSIPQLRFLMGWAFADFTDAGGRQTLFSLLKAILSRRVREIVEVYDVMKRVQELLVQSQSAPLRSLCASALLQFLLDWPLEERRLKQHLEFLFSNLDYEYEDGRLQVCALHITTPGCHYGQPFKIIPSVIFRIALPSVSQFKLPSKYNTMCYCFSYHRSCPCAVFESLVIIHHELTPLR